MRVFVTGASGFVGSAVVKELIKSGHEVLGLARSDRSAKLVESFGAKVHPGDLEDLSSLKSGAASCDGVVHTGFNHDFSKFKENCEKDKRSIDAIGSTLAGSQRPFVITSGIGILPGGAIVTEESMPLPTSPNPRLLTELAARELMTNQVNVSLVRLPPTTHGAGDYGFIPILIKIAKDKGVSVYSGNGQNTWPAVHRLDAAKVFRLALERAQPHSYYHAVAEEGVPFKQIAEAIGRGLNLPVVSKSPEEAAVHFSWFAHFASMNIQAKSQITRETLKWSPNQPDLMTDLSHKNYFPG